eukprot:m.51846 g.51846  ORF g.51846 m.51846 type:complete len:325 (+) comp6642_c0_seq2:58-1032(+)
MLFDDASNDRFELRFELAEVLGRGRFGIVRACEDKQTGESYAVKIVDKRKHSDVEQMVSEVAVLRQLKHPNLPAFVELFESEQYVYLVQERVRGEEVFSRIEAQGPLPEDVARPVLAQLLDALTYLHDDLSLIHRDLKPEHILYSNRNFVLPVKLLDFGVACRCDKGTKLTDIVGTPGYVAPEVIGDSEYDHLADLFAVGVILYVMLSASEPFFAESDTLVLARVMANDYSFDDDIWENISDEAKDLISSLLEPNPAKRLSAAEARAHPWLQAGSTVEEQPPTAVAAGDGATDDATDDGANQDQVAESLDALSLEEQKEKEDSK